MRSLETEQDKIKKICDVLRYETLEPAQTEAKKIIDEAKKRAEHIISEAHTQASELLAKAQQTIEKERNVFQSSLVQTSKQTMETLRQSIEEELFNPQLRDFVSRHTSSPQVVAKLITCIVDAVEKEGLNTDLLAYIPSTLSPQDVNKLLTEEILNKLKDHSVSLGNFAGGAKVRLVDKRITIDITNHELESLMSRFLRKDFRKMMFASQ